MNAEVQKQIVSPSARKVFLISSVAFIFLMLALSAQLTYTMLKYDKIYKGIYINDIHVGGMSADSAEGLLKEKYQSKVESLEIPLKAKDTLEKVKLSDINLIYNIESTVNEAYSVGRGGSLFQRLYLIYSTSRDGKKFELGYSYDKNKVDGIVQALYNKTFVKVKEADLLIQDERVTIRSGSHGESIDKEQVLAQIDKSISSGSTDVLEFPVINTPSSRINVDEYHKQINVDVQDAYAKVENNSPVIVPHVPGRSIDKASLASIALELEGKENMEKVLPVVFTKPKITKDDVQARLFKDTLATANTQFYTDNQNNSNRGENIRIAVGKINGKVLAPGDTFSFNNIVGPRTEEGGYKVAHVYSGGKIVDDVGGGICQVSTTLYNSILYSDLEVNERTNHMFTVGYVPLGRDAAVSYDSVDFKFINNTKWPVKLEGFVTRDNKIIFTVKGTNDSPGKTVEIVSNKVKTLDFTTKYVNDPTLEEGVTEVVQEGMTGFVIDTYKIIKKDGKVISEAKLHTSTYNPLTREVRKGTKKPAGG